MTALHEILINLANMDKGETVEFNNGQQEGCSVLFDDLIVDGETIPAYAITFYRTDIEEFVTDHMRDIDIVAMFIYTELKKNRTLLN
jgi:hypothetical protein